MYNNQNLKIMQKDTKVVINGKLLLEVFEDGNGYSSTCQALGTHSYGDTEHEAFSNLKGAMDLLFQDLVESGDLEEYLQELGWNVTKTISTTNDICKITISPPSKFEVFDRETLLDTRQINQKLDSCHA